MLITSMITDRIGRHEVLLPINQNYDNLRKKLDVGYTFSEKKATVKSARCTTIARAYEDNQSRSRSLL